MERNQAHRTRADLATHVVEAADAIVASARTGAPVSLTLTPRRPAPFGPADAAHLLMNPETKHAPSAD